MAASLQTAKGVLRKAIKERLSLLSDAEIKIQSKLVTDKLLRSPQYVKSQRVSVYLSMKDEVNTDAIVRNLLDTKRDCFIPHYVGPTMKMVRLRSWADYESLPETKWKIKQPKDISDREEALETGGLDLIVVPGLGFTHDGSRLGRGRGYYDKYLYTALQMPRSPELIALGFLEQMEEYIPTTETDMKINLVLWPTQEEINQAKMEIKQ